MITIPASTVWTLLLGMSVMAFLIIYLVHRFEKVARQRDHYRDHLWEVARFIEPHWQGAGLPLESGWIIREIKIWVERMDNAEDQVGAMLRKAAPHGDQ